MCIGTEPKIREASRFEQHMEDFTKELSSASFVAQQGCSADEFIEIKRTIGGIITRVDTLLHDQGTLDKI
jgi:hypothetical protein